MISLHTEDPSVGSPCKGEPGMLAFISKLDGCLGFEPNRRLLLA